MWLDGAWQDAAVTLGQGGMTVSSTDRKAGPFAGDGVATAFPFTFKIFTTTDLSVIHMDADGVETTLVLDSDYSVTLNSDQSVDPGGSVTYPLSGSPLPSDEKLTLLSDIPDTQPAALSVLGRYDARVLEDAYDRGVILTQQLAEQLARAVLLSVSTTGVSTTLPVPSGDKYLGWNTAGTALENKDAPSGGGGGGGDLSAYLTKAEALTTYLKLTDAAASYLTLTSAASTYLTISTAASTYLTQASAASTYATRNNAAFTGRTFLGSESLAQEGAHLWADAVSTFYVNWFSGHSGATATTASFRDFVVCDGKGAEALRVTGSSKIVSFAASPTAPTPTAGDNTTKLATTAFVQTAVSGAYVSKDQNYSAVGSFCFCFYDTVGTTVNPGTTVSGGYLKPAGILRTDGGSGDQFVFGSALSGTWRCVGYVGDPADSVATLFQRIA